jgi:hypothetical protein
MSRAPSAAAATHYALCKHHTTQNLRPSLVINALGANPTEWRCDLCQETEASVSTWDRRNLCL